MVRLVALISSRCELRCAAVRVRRACRDRGRCCVVVVVVRVSQPVSSSPLLFSFPFRPPINRTAAAVHFQPLSQSPTQSASPDSVNSREVLRGRRKEAMEHHTYTCKHGARVKVTRARRAEQRQQRRTAETAAALSAPRCSPQRVRATALHPLDGSSHIAKTRPLTHNQRQRREHCC